MALTFSKIGQASLAKALPVLVQDTQKLLPRAGRVFGFQSKAEKALEEMLRRRPDPGALGSYLDARLHLRKGLPDQTTRDRIMAAVLGGGAAAGGLGTYAATRPEDPWYEMGAQPAAQPKYGAAKKTESQKRIERAHKDRMKTWKKRERTNAKFRWDNAPLHKRDTTPSTPFKREDLPVAKPAGVK